MSRAAFALAVFLSLELSAAGAVQDGVAHLSTIQLPDGFQVERASIQDVDGDGVADLVVVSNGFVRRLSVYLRKKTGPASWEERIRPTSGRSAAAASRPMRPARPFRLSPTPRAR